MDKNIKEIRSTIMVNPGLLDSEWTMPNGYRYLITVEKPLSIDQIKMLCTLIANLREDSYFNHYYDYQKEFTCVMPVMEADD